MDNFSREIHKLRPQLVGQSKTAEKRVHEEVSTVQCSPSHYFSLSGMTFIVSVVLILGAAFYLFLSVEWLGRVESLFSQQEHSSRQLAGIASEVDHQLTQVFLTQRDFIGQELTWRMNREMEKNRIQKEALRASLASLAMAARPDSVALIGDFREQLEKWEHFNTEVEKLALSGDPDTARALFYDREQIIRNELQHRRDKMVKFYRNSYEQELSQGGVHIKRVRQLLYFFGAFFLMLLALSVIFLRSLVSSVRQSSKIYWQYLCELTEKSEMFKDESTVSSTELRKLIDRFESEFITQTEKIIGSEHMESDLGILRGAGSDQVANFLIPDRFRSENQKSDSSEDKEDGLKAS